MLRFFIPVLAMLWIPTAYSQTRFNTSVPLLLEYESKAWNKDPRKADSSALLLRDNLSKRIVQIELTETGDNTNEFVGQYSVNWGEKEVIPEVYLVPQELAKSPEQMQKVESLIKEGALLRKPFFFRMKEKKLQVLTVYDTKEQALAAFEEHRRLRTATAPPIDPAALEAQSNAARSLERKKLENDSAEHLNERGKLEAEEKARQENLKKQQDQFAAEEKERRKRLAEQAAELGINLYKTGQYNEAEKEFSRARELDPSHTGFFFQYGATLYRNGKYNRSLAVLSLAQGPGVNPVEREFFIASNHMKLKENENAIRHFESVKNSDDKVLSPVAAFYAGVVQYENENYQASKANFEFVLDHSADPALDRQAESYIEQIANISAFHMERQRKYILSVNAGLTYDSNILAIPKTQISQPTDLSGFRWSYGGSFEYRAFYSMKHELSALLSANDVYSTDQSFKAAQSFQDMDPLSLSLYLPYKYKGLAWGKAYQMTLSPGYESLAMNADSSGPRETILTSAVLRNDHTFVMAENWFSTYSIEFRQDQSSIDTSLTPEEDLTGTRLTLSAAQTFFQDQRKTEAWIYELGAAQSKTNGSNASFNRIDAAVSYMAPWKWDTSWSARLGFFYSSYPEHTTGRTDNGQSLALALRKPFNTSLSGILLMNYTNNGSTHESYDYNKYMLSTMLSWTVSP